MIKVIKAGIETSIQDYPGRVGYLDLGIPASGPVDHWSFRLANLLVGNDVGSAGLECQMKGPTLKFSVDTTIAITGANMRPRLDGKFIPMWRSVSVRANQILDLSYAELGMRSYIAISGGILNEKVLGSRATFHKAGIGGINGHALSNGLEIPIKSSPLAPIKTVKSNCKPQFSKNKTWEIEVLAGPNDDWLDDAGRARFINTRWQLSPKNDRTGFRLIGPEFTFSKLAYDKGLEHGSDPSNILDHGYPRGAINLAGQTPIILLNDSPSLGGFINPFTVASAAFWKLAQSQPYDDYYFKLIDLEEAYHLSQQLDRYCSRESIIVA